MSNGTRFSNLHIEGWRQFEAINIAIHPSLTVLTGANGTGKTTMLNMFSQHFGWNRNYLATPLLSKGGVYSYRTGLFERLKKRQLIAKGASVNVGSIHYSNNSQASLQVPRGQAIQYQVNLAGQQSVEGVHVSSYRVPPNYHAVANIPTSIVKPSQAYKSYHSEQINRHNGNHSQFTPLYRMKESLISMATFGPSSSRSAGNPEVLAALEGFIEVLKKVLPPGLGFIDLSIRTPEVVVVTRSGEFVIDSASGGVLTIIDLAWQIYLYSLGRTGFVVTIDEPENHLHPSMQRSLLKDFIAAFPNVQFIIATHSPFMVTSVKDSNVYVLRYHESIGNRIDNEDDEDSSSEKVTLEQRVVSEKLDTINKAGSASEVLREVLGVRVTIPEWVEDGLAAIVARYSGQELTQDLLLNLRKELSTMGYDALYGDALTRIIEKRSANSD